MADFLTRLQEAGNSGPGHHAALAVLLVTNSKKLERLIEAVEGMKRVRHSESQYWKGQSLLALRDLNENTDE